MWRSRLSSKQVTQAFERLVLPEERQVWCDCQCANCLHSFGTSADGKSLTSITIAACAKGGTHRIMTRRIPYPILTVVTGPDGMVSWHSLDTTEWIAL